MNNLESNHPGIDYHIHTRASADGSGTVEEYCAAAEKNGYRELGFSEHLDLDPALPHYNTYDHAEATGAIEKAAAQYPDITLRTGIEVTYQPEFEGKIVAAIEDIQLDYIIGSVHIIGEAENCITVEEGAREYFRDKYSAEEGYGPYFELVLEAVKFGYFDVIGHFDVIKRYGSSILEPLDPHDFYGPIRRILEGIIKRDMSLELNTSGLFHHVREVYPSAGILKLYHELGGRRLTLGSDAHRPEELGRGMNKAVDILRRLGFEEITVYEKRLPRQVPLP